MALTQTHYRFRTDGNAVDATPTWGADEDASPSPATTPFRLRLGLYGTSAASGEFEIYAQKNAGSYAAITTSAMDGVQSYDASSDADDTMLRIPRLSLTAAAPDWWLAGAAIDLDFVGNRIYPSGGFSDYLSCSRASDGYAQNSAGEWVQFSSNVLRRTDLGLLVEDPRTNYLLNSGTPATQTTESLATGNYTLWVEGSGSALASGGTATITGASSATDGSPDSFAVTVAGTVTVTVTGTLDRFQLEAGAFATSYIATGATSAARAADVVTGIGDLATLIKQVTNSQVFHVGNLEGQSPLAYEGLCRCGSNIFFIEGTTAVTAYNGVNLTRTYPTGNALTVETHAGLAKDTNGRSLVVNDGTVISDANADTLQTATPHIGRDGEAGGAALNDYIKRITFWSSRLADATLKEFTVP